MKNHSISYLKLRKNAHKPTCCIHIAKRKNINRVAENIIMYCTINSDFTFFRIVFREICSKFSLFFILFIHSFVCDNMYRNRTITNIRSINSFRIQNNVQNFQSRQSLYVMNVCKKNWSNNPITNILHSKAIR